MKSNNSLTQSLELISKTVPYFRAILKYHFSSLKICYLLFLLGASLTAQVRIGNIDPASATFLRPAAATLLHVEDEAGNKGILIPKVQLNNLSNPTPLPSTLNVGTLVFNSGGTNAIGYYYWSGSATGWLQIESATNDNDIYKNDGVISTNRIIDIANNSLELNGNGSKDGFTLRRDSNNETIGMSYKNSNDSFESAIYMQSPQSTGLVFATKGSENNVEDLEPTMILSDVGQIVLPNYGNTTTFDANPLSFIGTDANGSIVKNNANSIIKNIFDTNGSLSGQRLINTANHSLTLTNSSNAYLTIAPAATGNIDNPFTFSTGNALEFEIRNTVGLGIAANREVILGGYADASFLDNSLTNRLLTISADGSLNVMDMNAAQQNIYTKDGTLTSDRVLYTDNHTLIIENDAAANQASQNNPLIIKESFSNPGSPSNGSLTFEHGTNQTSSIVFKSGVNQNSDYGLIRFEDNASGIAGSTNHSLLTLETGNDGAGIYQDDININASGALGINIAAPDGSATMTLGRDNQGMLVNRVTLSSATIAAPVTNPANGLLVFNTATNLTAPNYADHVRPGFYYWSTASNRWVSQTKENRTARFTNTDTSINLNSTTGEEARLFGAVEWNDDPSLFRTVGGFNNDLFVEEDGRYQITVNIPITRNDTEDRRTNIDAQIEITRTDAGGNITNTYVGGISAANYIRNASNHNHSIIKLDEIVVLEAGDDISIYLVAEADTSPVVNMRSVGAANFTIRKLK